MLTGCLQVLLQCDWFCFVDATFKILALIFLVIFGIPFFGFIYHYNCNLLCTKMSLTAGDKVAEIFKFAGQAFIKLGELTSSFDKQEEDLSV